MRFKIFIVSVILLMNCSRTNTVKNAFEALDAKQYAVAVEMLKYDFNKSKVEEKKANNAFLLAYAFENMNNMEEAGEWFQAAYKLGYGNKALLGYIRYIIWDERYIEAISLYKTLKSRSNRSSAYRREILQLKQVQLWLNQDTSEQKIIKSSFLNTKYSDYALSFVNDDQLIFTSDRPNNHDNSGYKWTGNAFSDIYTTSRNDDFVRPWMDEINSDDNDGIAALNENHDELIFVRCYSDYIDVDATCKLMRMNKYHEEWSKPIVIDFVDKNYNYGSPFWNKDGSLLFFSSDMKGGIGNYDIYSVTYDNRRFGQPINLGSRINTEGDEKFPTIHRDTLFYSSDHLTGMGGLDIFKAYLRYDSTWSNPQNLKSPINSGGDDFYFLVDEMFIPNDHYISKAYFSSSRKNGFGGDDIYEYYLKHPKKIEVPQETIKKNIHLVLKSTYPKYENRNIVTQNIIGKEDLPKVNISIDTSTYITDKIGLCLLDIELNQDLEFLFEKDNYFTQKLNVSTNNISENNLNNDTTLFYEVLMIPIRKNKEVVIEDIFYDYDKWNLRSDAIPALNNLYEMLLLNPDLVIELSSHTDCRGEVDYNQLLSTKRAQSVVDYLVSKGIYSNRLVAKGYGFTAPVINCICTKCTDEEHQKNRRTSFKILSY